MHQTWESLEGRNLHPVNECYNLQATLVGNNLKAKYPIILVYNAPKSIHQSQNSIDDGVNISFNERS